MCVNCSNNACGGCQPKIPQGLPGINGKNAFTYTTDTFSVPAVSSNVTITVQNTGQYTNIWAVPGQIVYINGAGYYQVVSTTGNNQITVTNLGYTGNAAQSTLIATNSSVSPAGLIGPQGTAGASGTAGSTSIYADTTITSAINTNTPVLLKTVIIPANTWVNYSATNADSILVNLSFSVTNTVSLTSVNTPLDNNIAVKIGSTNLFYLNGVTRAGKVNVSIKITRAQSSGLFYSSSSIYLGGFTPINSMADKTPAQVLTSPINLDIYISQTRSGNIALVGMTIDKITA